MVPRAGFAALLLSLAGCGGAAGFQRPDYAAEARAKCDEADATRDPHRALALYGLALEADPKFARAYLGRARLLEATGRSDEAERNYSMGVESATDDVRPRYLLARAQHFLKTRRTESAIRDLTRAIGLLATWPDPEVAAESRLLRAEFRVSVKDWDGAREDLDALDRAAPDSRQRERAHGLRVRVNAAEGR